MRHPGKRNADAGTSAALQSDNRIEKRNPVRRRDHARSCPMSDRARRRTATRLARAEQPEHFRDRSKSLIAMAIQSKRETECIATEVSGGHS